MKPEQKIQRDIVKLLESKGAYVVKVISATKKGVVDLLVCYKGRHISIEVKAPGELGNVSALQAHNLRLAEKAGGLTLVTDNVYDVINLLHNVES